MAVTFDVPGIGKVEAQGAASEATLQDILKALGGSGGAGGGGGGGGGGGAATKKATDATKKFTDATNEATDSSYSMGQQMGMVAAGAGVVVGKFLLVGETATKIVENFANVGDSVEKAAGIFNSVPLVGPMFSAVAGAATAVVDGFQKATASGATFGGSVSEFAATASAAGMTLDQFAGVIANNGAGMVALGGTVEAGAKRFGTLSRELRTTSSGLYALGFSTTEINEGLAEYAGQLRMQGLSRGRSDKELISGAQKYLKEMDALAKITGQSRKEKEEERKRLLTDAQFQASMAGVQKDVRDSFLNTVQQLPAGLQDFSKDILATGTATTAENQKLMSQMPRSAAMLAQFHAKMQRGEAITTAERNQLNNLMAQEGQQALKNIKYAGAANSELSGVVNSLAETQKMQEDAVVEATESQKKAQEQSDGMAEGMEATKQTLAEFSNAFQMALANSGILEVLLGAFQVLATMVMDYVVPTFQWFAGFVSNHLYPVFLDVATIFVQHVIPALQVLGGVIADYVWPAFKTIGGFISDQFMPIMVGLGIASLSLLPALFAQAAATWALISPILVAAAPFIAIAAAVAAVVGIFKYLYDTGWTFGSFFESIIDFLKRYFMMPIKELIFKIMSNLPSWMGGYDDEEAAEARKKLDEQYAELDERKLKREQERERIAAERNADEEADAAESAQIRSDIDAKFQGQAEKFQLSYEQGAGYQQQMQRGNIEDARNVAKVNDLNLKNAKKAGEAGTQIDKNYKDSLSLLMAEKQQQSKGTPKATAAAASGVAGATSNPASAVTPGKDTESSSSTPKTSPAGATGGTSTQEKPKSATELLNSNIETLISLMKYNNNISNKMLMALRESSKDLYGAL